MVIQSRYAGRSSCSVFGLSGFWVAGYSFCCEDVHADCHCDLKDAP